MLRSARRIVSCFNSSSERGPQLCANERNETAALGLHHREQREPDRARVLVALLNAELGAELAFHRARAFAGEKQQVAGAHRVHVVRDRRARRRELDAQLLETFFRAHDRVTTFPGFIRLCGSKTFLMSRIRPITSSPSSACSEPCLPMPMPCSPVQVPSMASARFTRRALRALASSISARLPGSTRITRWKLPSPTWPKSGIGIEARSISFAVSVMHSARREIGTHTSVDTAREPGLSCRQAK